MCGAFALTAVLLGICSVQLQAQKPSTVVCNSCRIEITPLVRLGDESELGMIDHLESRAIRNARGRYVVKSNYPTVLSLFDRTGKFLRSIGKKGNGPGEFQGIGAIAFGPNDSLHVFDQVLHRYSVFDPEFRFVSSGPLPLGPELQTLILPTGDYVFGLPIRTPAEIGQPLHRVDRSGRIGKSFGSQSGLFRPDIPYFDRRAIANSNGGAVWSAYRTQYVVERWNPTTGRYLSEIRRDVSWFPSRMTVSSSARNHASSDSPEPFVMAIRESKQGILWVLIAVADKNYRSAIGPRRNTEEHLQITNEQRYFDTIVEAFDAATGRFLASVRVPEYIRQFAADDEVGSVIEDEKGIPRLHLWRVTLKPN